MTIQPTAEPATPQADADLLALLKPSTIPPEQSPGVQAVREAASKLLRLLPANTQRTRALQFLVDAADAAKRSIVQGAPSA